MPSKIKMDVQQTAVLGKGVGRAETSYFKLWDTMFFSSKFSVSYCSFILFVSIWRSTRPLEI